MIDSQGVEVPEAAQETHEDAGPEIDRGDLRRLLIDAMPAGTLVWDRNLRSVRSAGDERWTLEFEKGEPVTADLVLGADGIASKVRSQLTSQQPRYTGITMLAANIRKDLWRNSTISDMLGEGSIMFAGGGKTIFVQRCNHDLILLYFSMKVQQGWPRTAGIDLDDKAAALTAIRAEYADWSPDLMDMVTEVEDAFQPWPISVMPPASTWKTQPGLTLLGDAAHVMPPFTGKGVNLALYDALDLYNELTPTKPSDLTGAISSFEKRMYLRTQKETGECLGVGAHFYGLQMNLNESPAA